MLLFAFALDAACGATTTISSVEIGRRIKVMKVVIVVVNVMLLVDILSDLGSDSDSDIDARGCSARRGTR